MMTRITPVNVTSAARFDTAVRTAPTTPTNAVATHGVRSVGWIAAIARLTGPGHARSRPELYSTRPNARLMASVALKMATATPRLRIVFTVEPPVAVTMYCIGV